MKPGRHTAWRASALAAALLTGGVRSAPADPDPSFKEYEVKAVFLFNFARFVDWPAPAAPPDAGPLTIGVLGDDPFGAVLEQTVRGETIHGHPLRIQRFRRLEDLGPCHLLFISRSEKARLPQVLRKVQGSGMLTVSDEDGFARTGGMIGLRTAQNRVQFEINLDAAEREGFRISAKLLKVARLVGRGAPAGE